MSRYLVTLMRTPDFQTDQLEPHRAFLDQLRGQGSLELAGPFTDGSGGAYLLQAESLDAARAIAFADPLYRSGSSRVTVLEWDAR